MKILDKIYFAFQRRTNTVAFIPQIDGLRFLAIILVVLFHANGFIVNKVPVTFTRLPTDYWLVNGMFVNEGIKGVLLFFTISGFILALPFAKQFWQGAKEVKLKNYFMRRLTRLEPPYFLTMVICYLAIINLSGHEFSAMFPRTYSGLFPILASSLTYTHNLFYPGALSINQVAWSLEIEIQFYLLLPLLVLILKFSPLWRRMVLAGLIALFTFLQHWFHPGVLTLFSFIQYFLLGFLLVDVYLSGVKIRWNWPVSFLAGLLSLMSFVYLDIYNNPYTEYIFIFALFLFCVLALTSGIWQKVFRLRPITAIGGMCYSIYLWHNIIISAVGNKTVKFNVSHSYLIELLWHLGILLPIVLLLSSAFYLLIERPCMDKDWPVKLWRFVKGLAAGKKINTQTEG